MKVLLISHYPPPAGGIASWTKRLLSLGLPDGWEIDLVNSNTINGRDAFQNVKRSMKDEWFRSRNIWRQEEQFLREDKDIKVVHTNIPCTIFGMIRETVTGIIAKKYKKKFILHCHCTVSNVVNNGFKRFFFKILTHYCDGIIVLNKKSEDFAKKYSKSKVALVPNFVSEAELADDNNKEIRSQVKDVMYVGGVTPEKGCDTIVEAAKRLPQMNFHLIGIVSAEIEAMNAPENVIFHGIHDNKYVKEHLPMGDVFLFLSRYWGEGFANALVEAMAAGLPCIVTDWAANANMIEDKGGKIIPQRDVDALVEALSSYENDVEARTAASKWNVQKVKNSYVSGVVIKQYTDFYNDIIGE